MTQRNVDGYLDEIQERMDDHTWPYVMVDATCVKVRKKARSVSHAVLVVAGINDGGRCGILRWRRADAESEDAWTEVFRALKQRGIVGMKCVLV